MGFSWSAAINDLPGTRADFNSNLPGTIGDVTNLPGSRADIENLPGNRREARIATGLFMPMAAPMLAPLLPPATPFGLQGMQQPPQAAPPQGTSGTGMQSATASSPAQSYMQNLGGTMAVSPAVGDSLLSQQGGGSFGGTIGTLG